MSREAAVVISITLILAVGGLWSIPKESSTPVVLVTLEATRADHVSCYGYERNTTPQICEIAEDGVLFKNSYSQATMTHLSIPSMLSSQPPIASGYPSYTEDKRRLGINPRLETIMDVLNRENYTTVGISQSIAYRGFDSGLDRTVDHYKNPGLEKIDGIIGERKSFFLWFFPIHPHLPYEPEKKYRKWDDIDMNRTEIRRVTYGGGGVDELDPGQVRSLYDAEIKQSDSYVGKVTDFLKRKGLYEDSLIIVTSDHGERLMNSSNAKDVESIAGHSGTPEESTVKVPLIVKFPENRYAGREVKQPVRLLDIAPTAYDVLNLEPENEPEGTSLLKTLGGKRLDLTPYSSSAKMYRDWAVFQGEKRFLLRNINDSCLDGAEPVKVHPRGMKDYTSDLCQIYRKGWENRRPGIEKDRDRSAISRLKAMGYIE